TPKITDFGLAKRLEDAGDGQTRTGAIMGTPSYMAPEQAAGGTKHLGPSADIYSLGAILYDMLTGRPPFRGTTVLDTLQLVQSAGPAPAGAPQAKGAPRPGDDLPEVPAEGSREALCHGRRIGRGPPALPGGRADPGAADARLGAHGQVGAPPA